MTELQEARLRFIRGWVSPTYQSLAHKIATEFGRKLEDIGQEGKYSGKYLIGVSNNPWERIDFIVASKDLISHLRARISGDTISFTEEIN